MNRGKLSLVWILCSVACTEISGPADQALFIEITATPASAVIGAPISFRFNARGNSLEGVALDYGDGSADSVATFLARTASGTYTHGYELAGSYRVLVTVLETGGLTAQDSVSVTVTQPAPAR